MEAEKNKITLYLATLSTILDLMEGKIMDSDFILELTDALLVLGHDPDILLSKPPIVAFQEICKGFTEVELSQELLFKLGEIEDV